MIKTFEHGTKEYIALQMVANGLEMNSKNGTKYIVKDVYFDFGANMMWTTVVAYRTNDDSWQALCPRDWELATSCVLENIAQAIKNTINSEYFPDK